MNYKELYQKSRPILDSLVIVLNLLIISIAVTPSVYIIFRYLHSFVESSGQIFILSFIFCIGYILFGINLLFLTIILKFIFGLKSKCDKISMFSKEMTGFVIYHDLIHVCDVFILKFIRSTFLINWYFKMMGCRIGTNTIINTTRVSDCDIITIGDDCVIGGDAVINGHSAEGNYLIRNPVKIGNNVTIGQYATILPGARIGDDVIIGANVVVPKNADISNGTIYTGTSSRETHAESSSSSATVKSNDLVSIGRDINMFDLLKESYSIRHSEVLSIERFMNQIIVSTLGLVVTLLMYSLSKKESKIIALIPMLIGFSYASILNQIFAMLKLGAHMYKIELLFNALGIRNFDWEIKEGIFGSARNIDIDSIFIYIIYLGIFVAGFYLTYGNYLFSEKYIYLGLNLRKSLLIVDLSIFLWIIFSMVFFIYKKRKYKISFDIYKKELDREYHSN